MSSLTRLFVPQLRAVQIWGAENGAGKTIASTILTWAAARRPRRDKNRMVVFLKPFNVGKGDTSEFLVRSAISKLLAGRHRPEWLKIQSLVHWPEWETSEEAMDTEGPGDREDAEKSRTMDGRTEEWSEAPAYDELDLHLMKPIRNFLIQKSKGLPPPGGWVFMETLGSPETRLPWGLNQADAYACSNLTSSNVLVGVASKQGGDKIIAACEALRARNLSVHGAMVFRDSDEAQHERVAAYFEELRVPCAMLRAIPARHPDARKDSRIMGDFFRAMAAYHPVQSLMHNVNRRHQLEIFERLAEPTDETEKEYLKLARSEVQRPLPKDVILAADIQEDIIKRFRV
ncbi:hypothetical protein BD289DRAFT_18015 [Coniella lustricola]|uniref:CobQ/CobB/MinD/ParA nucleotide binding domain-containing protein n=1 Tax=Coniella lustricola TaxID=2025994 RepID=A0A2T3AJA9_9PEZI|nr:hypothetical protein BD289DRAFT_18015 [Coniella lustricola]